VCWEYRVRLATTAMTFARDESARRFLLNLVLGFLPLAVLGLLFQKAIKAYLFKPVPVALAFIIGGVLILLVDRREGSAVLHETDEVRPLTALKLGCWQALALFPGTSRAAATIIGGMLMGMSRRLATEYSFFLAIPTLLAATGYELVKHWRSFDTGSSAGPVVLSAVISFVTAFLAVRALLRYIGTHSFAVFAWYRIAAGLLIIGAAWNGCIRW
jgi:undecaprenyl-diphosphatase